MYGSVRTSVLPRPKGRGPIEAWRPAPANRLAESFRDRKVAAPLKQGACRGRLGGGGAAFRDRKVAAPLKHP